MSFSYLEYVMDLKVKSIQCSVIMGAEKDIQASCLHRYLHLNGSLETVNRKHCA